MRHRPLIILTAAAAAVALAVYLWYLIPTLALSHGCGDKVRGESASPDGRVVATFHIRNCGATTSFGSIVSLRTASSRFNPKDDFAALVIDGACDLRMSWPAADTLLLQYPATCELFRAEKRWRDVQISSKPR